MKGNLRTGSVPVTISFFEALGDGLAINHSWPANLQSANENNVINSKILVSTPSRLSLLPPQDVYSGMTTPPFFAARSAMVGKFLTLLAQASKFGSRSGARVSPGHALPRWETALRFAGGDQGKPVELRRDT